MADVEFRFAWGRRDQKLIDDARQFWREQDVMSPEDIEARAEQLCALAYSNGKVVAVSTVHPYDYLRLRARFAYYRTMVSPDFRRQDLASRLCVYSRDGLAEWAREHPEEKFKGLFIVMQAEEFRDRQHVPTIIQLDLKLVLVGYTPDGSQIRVVWFDDATVE
jgi:GNAT superfamily N-acetyltransferase